MRNFFSYKGRFYQMAAPAMDLSVAMDRGIPLSTLGTRLERVIPTKAELEKWMSINRLMVVTGLLPQLARMGWYATTDTQGRYIFVLEDEGRFTVIEGPGVMGLVVWRN